MSKVTQRISWKVQDLENLPQSEETRYELIGGELFVTRSPHRKHQQVAGQIFQQLNIWSKKTGLGETIPSPGIIFDDADSVIPDVVWVSTERLKAIEDEAGHLTGAPELVVEVLSPGSENFKRDRETKLQLYSITGVDEYWIVDRFKQLVDIYRRREAELTLVATLLESEEITSPLLPDFHCLVQNFF